jgi:hypothetical protein
MVLLYVWYVPSQDENHSPFNVGERVGLPKLNRIQVQNLVNLHKLN